MAEAWTEAKLAPPFTYDEAVIFVRQYFEAVNVFGWQTSIKTVWNDDGNVTEMRISRQYVGFDPVSRADAAINSLQHGLPLDDEQRDIALFALWELQKSEAQKGRGKGRPAGSDLHGSIWIIAHILSHAGMNLSRNNESAEATSAFDAVADALRSLGEKPNSYSGVSGAFYSYPKKPVY